MADPQRKRPRRRRRRERAPRGLTITETRRALRIRYAVPLTHDDWANAFTYVLFSGVAIWIGPWVLGGNLLEAIEFAIYGVVALIALYFSIARFVNHYEVVVADGWLRVLERPLPALGPRVRIPAAEVAQLYCTDDPPAIRVQGSGPELLLLGGLESLDRARAIERRVEAHLGLEDVPVPGEAPRADGARRRPAPAKACGQIHPLLGVAIAALAFAAIVGAVYLVVG